MYSLDFTLPGLPKLTNAQSRGHWAVAYKEAKLWKNWVIAIAKVQRPPQPLKLAKVVLTRFSCSKTGPDFDNLAHSFKHVLDGLKAKGGAEIIKDDGPANIETHYRWEACRRGEGRIRIEVYELSIA